jgi:uncharacterized protein (DUF433 family)
MNPRSFGAASSCAGHQCYTARHASIVTVDPKVCEGKATIRGLRITVDFKLLGDGYDANEIVREYPELEREDVLQAAKYGAWLASERVSNIA